MKDLQHAQSALNLAMHRTGMYALALLTAASAACTAPNSRGLDAFDAYLLRSDARYAVRAGGEEPSNGTVKVTFLGATTLLIDDGDTQLMIDGFLTRPSLCDVISDSEVQTNPQIVDAALARAGVGERLKAIFVSHSHYDHALDVVHIVKGHPGTVLYGSPSTRMIGAGGGLTAEQAKEFPADQPFPVGSFYVTVLASKHSPPTVFNDDLGVPITKPLRVPARISEYAEGGSYDFLIKHGTHNILIKASANFVSGALDRIHADVVFLGTGRLGKQRRAFRESYFDQTVERIHPQLVIPIHWDDFFTPLSENLAMPNNLIDDSAAAFDFLIERIGEANRRQPADQAGITFRILQGYESAILFRQGT